jgi:hypothetical protein
MSGIPHLNQNRLKQDVDTLGPLSGNLSPCLVRPENQFSLTRAVLSTSGRAKSKFLSVNESD